MKIKSSLFADNLRTLKTQENFYEIIKIIKKCE